ncbi:MAG: McrB family protein, partial [Candidatus Woesearchaeota archaeon]
KNTQDVLLSEIKNTEDGKYHRLKPNYIDSINKVYDRKIPLYNLLIWIFRFYKIENNTTFYDLKNKFMKEYNLSYDELSNLFDISDNTNIKLEKSNNPVDSQNIREKLQVVDEVELLDDIEVENKTFLKESSLELKSEVNNNIIEHKPENMKQEEFFNLLEKHKQIILTGVPGTGKSYTANEISKKYSKIKKIQFHENYTYQDFIIGKTIRNGSVYYEKGDLIKFLEEIQNEQGIFLLILDEINRGNISSIFGELIYALDRDYNDIKIPLEENSIELKLPDNLHILGTMNSADRSIAVVDFAIRRRFLFVELEPDYNNLDELAKVDGKEILGSFLSKVNKNIENIFESKDYCLGHSFFLTQQIDNNYIYEILKYKIYPTIIEYAHGDRKVLENIFSRELLEAEPSNIIEKIEEFINND